MFYKKGDKVKLENNLIIGEEYGRLVFTPQLAKLNGKILTIDGVTQDRFYIVEDEGDYYKVCIKMIKSVPTFKKGDKVRIRRNLVIGNNYRDAVFKESMKSFSGKIVTIKNVWTIFHRPVYEIEECPFVYRVNDNNVTVIDGSKSSMWSEEMFKCLVGTSKPEENNFTKADLKDGMVVEDADGDKGVVLGDKIIGTENYVMLSEFNDNLKCSKYKNATINKVYKSTANTLPEYFFEKNLELIWERIPKYYNGKVVCVNNATIGRYTVGKIYQFTDGYVKDNLGRNIIPTPVESFDEFQSYFKQVEWFEIKE